MKNNFFSFEKRFENTSGLFEKSGGDERIEK